MVTQTTVTTTISMLKCIYVLSCARFKREKQRKKQSCTFSCMFPLQCWTVNTQEAHWLQLAGLRNIINAVYHRLDLNAALEPCSGCGAKFVACDLHLCRLTVRVEVCTEVKKGHLIRCGAEGADAKNLPQKCFAGSVHIIEMRRTEVTRGWNATNHK